MNFNALFVWGTDYLHVIDASALYFFLNYLFHQMFGENWNAYQVYTRN